MKTSEFLKVLENNLEKELIFEYANEHLVGTNYHLTEVKNVFFDTVDCGGKPNEWHETHLQLWESPQEIGKPNYLKTDKFLSILQKVNSIKALLLDTDIKIEYGSDTFSTSVMPIESIEISAKYLKMKLFMEQTRCKANDVCGITEVKEENACCTSSGCC
jgi:hypothetical protein